MVQRQDVEFPGEGGVTLRGWLFQPDAVGRYPAITMAHGFAGVKEHGLERFAWAFAQAGFSLDSPTNRCPSGCRNEGSAL